MRLHNETNYDIRILQRRIIGNMEAIDQVCREHGLRYYLWAGTMLGAVRHKGFIPWDDDGDVDGIRNELEKLTKKEVKALSVYLIIPLFCMLIQMAVYGLLMIVIGTSVASLFLFVSILKEQMEL